MNTTTRIQELLKQVRHVMNDSAQEPGSLGEAAAWHLARPGKLFRARLVIATGLAVGVEEDTLVPLASAVELLHNASLVHDDLQDDELERRGRPTAWRQHGPEVALLLGDHWIVRSFALLGQLPGSPMMRSSLLNLFSQRVLEIIRGQGLDLDANLSSELGADDYRRLACAKTGALIALAAEAPLVAAGRPVAEVEDARRALMLVGLGYQLADDLEEFAETAVESQPREIVKRLRTSAVVVEYFSRYPERRSAWQRILRSEFSVAAQSRLRAFLRNLFESGVGEAVSRESHRCLQAAGEIAQRLPDTLRALLLRQSREIITRLEVAEVTLAELDSNVPSLGREEAREVPVATAA